MGRGQSKPINDRPYVAQQLTPFGRIMWWVTAPVYSFIATMRPIRPLAIEYKPGMATPQGEKIETGSVTNITGPYTGTDNPDNMDTLDAKVLAQNAEYKKKNGELHERVEELENELDLMKDAAKATKDNFDAEIKKRDDEKQKMMDELYLKAMEADDLKNEVAALTARIAALEVENKKLHDANVSLEAFVKTASSAHPPVTHGIPPPVVSGTVSSTAVVTPPSGGVPPLSGAPSTTAVVTPPSTFALPADVLAKEDEIISLIETARTTNTIKVVPASAFGKDDRERLATIKRILSNKKYGYSDTFIKYLEYEDAKLNLLLDAKIELK